MRVDGRLAEEQTVRIDIQMSSTQGQRRVVRYLRKLEVRVSEVVPSEEKAGQQEAFLEVTRNQRFTFSDSEEYSYAEGREIVHRF